MQNVEPISTATPPISKENSDKEDSVVAILPCCGRLVFACVTHRIDEEMRKQIGELASIGCNIEHWPVDAVRKANWGCTCMKG